MEYRSALLASKGYVALSLEYSDQKDAVGKPRTVGIEYFEVLDFILQNMGSVVVNL